MQYFLSILQFCNHLEEEEKAGCLVALLILSYRCIVTKMFCGSSSRCHVVCDCGISQSYLLLACNDRNAFFTSEQPKNKMHGFVKMNVVR